MVSLKRDYARLMKKWSKYYRDAMTALANHNTTKFDPGPSQEDREILGRPPSLNWDKLMFWLWELKTEQPNLRQNCSEAGQSTWASGLLACSFLERVNLSCDLGVSVAGGADCVGAGES